jgi:hypothetical protein
MANGATPQEPMMLAQKIEYVLVIAQDGFACAANRQTGVRMKENFPLVVDKADCSFLRHAAII